MPEYDDLEEIDWDLPPQGPPPWKIPGFLWNGPIVDGKLTVEGATNE